MTTPQVIDTVGSWKLGGTYEDESAANTQLRILNLVNIARQKLLRDFYIANKSIPQVCYQEFDITPSWTDENCVSFTAVVPKVISLPFPQSNGWDAVVLQCENSMPLTEVASEQQLRAFRNHTLMSKYRTGGWYMVTGDFMQGWLKKKIKSDGITARAVLATPQDMPSFNFDKDQYPFPDDMLSDMKRLLEGDDGRRWMMANSQVSNSKSEIDNANRK